MNVPEQVGEEKVVYQGKIVEVIRTPMKIGEREVEFESARRSPGVRLLIVNGDKILLTKEHRTELGGYDFRLPGGKVFDALEDYNKAFSDGADLLEHAIEAAKKEAVEEVGLKVNKIEHLHTSHSGATVVWNLYYFLVADFEEVERELEEGEVIHPEWKTFEEVRQLCLDGEVREDRSVAVLLRYLLG